MSNRFAPPELVALYAEALSELCESEVRRFAGWRLVVDTKPRGSRFGQCRYSKKELAVSDWLIRLNGADHPQVKETLRHEMAHVLTGPTHGHDLQWKVYAIRLGASTSARVSHDLKIKTPPGWVSTCPKCGKKGALRTPGKPRAARACSTCFSNNRRAGMSRYEAGRDCTLTFRKEA